MEQADVDNAFAEFDRAMLLVTPHPAPALRDALLCVSCGSDRYTYNNSGSCEAGARVCDDCGVVQPGNIIFEHMFGRRLSCKSSNYKRIHHWHERISQMLIMESRIAPEHMVAIAERLLDGSHATISKDTIRSVLRSLKLQVYIEKWLQIIERCTGIVPPCPGPTILMQLDQQFMEIEKPFLDTKPNSRRNFLNYNYVFCRLLQRMGCTKFCMFFPLIRSKHKLRALDETWFKMMALLGWPSEPLESVQPFAVKVHDAPSLLLRLKATISSIVPSVPRPMPWRTVQGRRWTNQTASQTIAKRLAAERFVPKIQTLALQLKRRKSQTASSPPQRLRLQGPQKPIQVTSQCLDLQSSQI